MTSETYYSNGKLLLTGEYVVLDGALSLAIPTASGQYLKATTLDEPLVIWKSFDYQGDIWFETIFSLEDLASGIKDLPEGKLKRLFEILRATKLLNSDFLDSGCQIETKLTFPQDWGLGSSSTLINNIATWAQVDPYKLLEQTFGGSGYDIACAGNNNPITYQLDNKQRTIMEVVFNPSFKDKLYFIYLNKKQNSRDGVVRYKTNTDDKSEIIKAVSNITNKLISSSHLNDFNKLIDLHEQLISSIIHQAPVKESLFSDFNGSIKSLGAWGGDFVLVTSDDNPTPYFNRKGYHTVIPYSKMIK